MSRIWLIMRVGKTEAGAGSGPGPEEERRRSLIILLTIHSTLPQNEPQILAAEHPLVQRVDELLRGW